MKKIIIIGFIILLFAGCEKKAEKNNEVNTESDLIEDVDITFPSYNSDVIDQGIIDQQYTIEKISSAIFKGFNTEWMYEKMDDFFTALQIKDNYTIKEQITDNIYQTQEGNIKNFLIDSGKYKLIIRNFSVIPGKYFLDSIEIDIKKNDYAYLFPYANMDEYAKDEGFGFIIMNDKDRNMISYAMRYGDDENLGYADLMFSNGVLESICMRMFWP